MELPHPKVEKWKKEGEFKEWVSEWVSERELVRESLNPNWLIETLSIKNIEEIWSSANLSHSKEIEVSNPSSMHVLQL